MSNKSLELFKTFFKIGAFTFGGGYAMIPIIQKEVAEDKHWIEEKEIIDVIAIAESTPGPLAINTATFVGYKVDGVMGAAAATLGVVLPSFAIILILALIYGRYKEIPFVENAFWGIRIAVIGLIINAFIKMYKQCPKNVVSYTIAAVAFIVVQVFFVNILYVILASAAIGIIYHLLNLRSGE